ncbi:MAG TPA: hypothetical protein VIX17_03865 [Pyrinomonadaceae bacterium]
MFLSLFWRTVIATVGPRHVVVHREATCLFRYFDAKMVEALASPAIINITCQPYVGSDGPRSINNGPALVMIQSLATG